VVKTLHQWVLQTQARYTVQSVWWFA